MEQAAGSGREGGGSAAAGGGEELCVLWCVLVQSNRTGKWGLWHSAPLILCHLPPPPISAQMPSPPVPLPVPVLSGRVRGIHLPYRADKGAGIIQPTRAAPSQLLHSAAEPRGEPFPLLSLLGDINPGGRGMLPGPHQGVLSGRSPTPSPTTPEDTTLG